MELDTTNKDKIIVNKVFVNAESEFGSEESSSQNKASCIQASSEDNGDVFDDLNSDNPPLDIEFEKENGDTALFPENCYDMFATSSSLKNLDLSGADGTTTKHTQSFVNREYLCLSLYSNMPLHLQ